MRDYDFEVPGWAWFVCFFGVIFCLDSQSRFTRQGKGKDLGDDSVRGMRIEGSGFKEQG